MQRCFHWLSMALMLWSRGRLLHRTASRKPDSISTDLSMNYDYNDLSSPEPYEAAPHSYTKAVNYPRQP